MGWRGRGRGERDCSTKISLLFCEQIERTVFFVSFCLVLVRFVLFRFALFVALFQALEESCIAGSHQSWLGHGSHDLLAY